MARASVRAVSADWDLALIGSRIKPLLAASFSKTLSLHGSQPVFVAGYDVLRHMTDRAGTMYNAMTRDAADAEPGELTLLSSATFGASGSPVLDAGGLVVGLVTDRAKAASDDPRSYATHIGAARYVIAVNDDPIETFLRASNVPFNETDTAQLEPMQAHAPRAATLEAGIICGE